MLAIDTFLSIIKIQTSYERQKIFIIRPGPDTLARGINPAQTISQYNQGGEMLQEARGSILYYWRQF